MVSEDAQPQRKQLLSICKLIVADAYFSKESFVSGVKSLGFNLISRFRDDVNLKYLYSGPKTGKRGRPQKFAGKVDVNNLDMNVFSEDYTAEGKLVYKMYTAVVWAVSLGCEVRVVLVDYEDAEKKQSDPKGLLLNRHRNVSPRHLRHLPDTFPAGVRLPRCQAVHRAHTLSGEKQRSSVVCLQRLAHFRQPRQGICPSARDGPLGRFNQNTAAQRCNGGSIYCNVRKISEHAIK